jgi:hypothetical protein
MSVVPTERAETSPDEVVEAIVELVEFQRTVRLANTFPLPSLAAADS